MIRRDPPALQPRARTFDVAQAPTHWCGGDPFRTRLFDAFSSLLPLGERFFIDALRRGAAELADPALDVVVMQFVQQEAVHSREHRRYNERLRAIGIDLERWDRSQWRTMSRLIRLRDVRIPLAITVAMEHLTALVSRAVLEDGVLAGAHPAMYAFWAWHAAEEIEHKAVALDVYERLGGDAAVRRVVMAWALFILGIRLTARMTELLRRDGVLFDRATWHGAAGLRGFAMRFARDLATYFRRDFHPWHEDDYHLVERWQRTQQPSALPN